MHLNLPQPKHLAIRDIVGMKYACLVVFGSCGLSLMCRRALNILSSEVIAWSESFLASVFWAWMRNSQVQSLLSEDTFKRGLECQPPQNRHQQLCPAIDEKSSGTSYAILHSEGGSGREMAFKWSTQPRGLSMSLKTWQNAMSREGRVGGLRSLRILFIKLHCKAVSTVQWHACTKSFAASLRFLANSISILELSEHRVDLEASSWKSYKNKTIIRTFYHACNYPMILFAGNNCWSPSHLSTIQCCHGHSASDKSSQASRVLIQHQIDRNSTSVTFMSGDTTYLAVAIISTKLFGACIVLWSSCADTQQRR